MREACAEPLDTHDVAVCVELVELVGRHWSRVVDLSSPERGEQRRLIRIEEELDLLEEWLTPPVEGVAFEFGGTATLPFDDLKRPAADDRGLRLERRGQPR